MIFPFIFTGIPVLPVEHDFFLIFLTVPYAVNDLSLPTVFLTVQTADHDFPCDNSDSADLGALFFLFLFPTVQSFEHDFSFHISNSADLDA
jgi:hypothetical protein